MIYLDHAATTPVPEEVAHAVYDTLVSTAKGACKSYRSLSGADIELLDESV